MPPKHESDDSVRWQYTDLGNKSEVMRALDGASAVIHLGEIPNLHLPMNPEQVYAHNTATGSLVMQSAADLSIPKVVYGSTCQVYGTWGHPPAAPHYLPVDERHPVQPTNAYAAGKIANEHYLEMLHEQKLIQGAALRFPYVYRPWYRSRLQHLKGFLSLREPHDGMTTYIGNDDLARAIVSVLELPMDSFEIYNASADDLMTGVPTREYMAAAYPNYPEVPEKHPTFGTLLNTVKLKAATGWSPAWSFTRWVRDQLEAQDQESSS
jgi:nucleoside-diphosphate-sugar epimerase